MIKNLRLIFLFFSFFPILAFAEVQQVTIKWSPGLCYEGCVSGLYKQFLTVRGAADVSINQSAAQMTFRWMPDVPFSFYDIDNAMRMIGVQFTDFRLTVRGTITHDKTSFYLVSLGDETRFILLGPLSPSATQYVEEYNEITYPLSEQLKDRLFQAENANEVAIIEGPLFEPNRSPPLELVAQKVNFEKVKPQSP